MHLSQHHLPIVFGERFDYKDRQFLRLLDLLHQSFSLLSSFSSQVFELFSGFLKYFPGTHKQIYRNLKEILDYIDHSVDKHRATLDASNPRDFIDTYLLRMEKEKSNPHTDFQQRNFTLTMLTLFFAGTETSSTTLRYGFLLMLKNTEVYPILSSALHDPQYFEQPDTFNPDRFLDANGALKKNEAFMPFSIGKCICLGEGIARHELFLFFTTLLQNFSLSSPVDPKDIDLNPKESGFGRVPQEYQICFLSR
ncbi:Cytochrome P450 2B1 [Cricetulus griseus]|uniref:Cytochrome P450 n=1 Tax=Cricetulus griseus TaxID=10029 RepID=G3IJW7_CRIGR|nr:Cytochrome P450 2B1 [Cricetulus griseus]